MISPAVKLSIAPMLDWSDRHYRYFMRCMTQHTLLYTEMITTGALIYGDTERFLSYDPAENPLALQLGGCDPSALAQCATLGEQYGYAEINLNAGCPSERVKSGKFGACLMAEPLLVAECVSAMKEACQLPITVKTRLGIDDQDSYEFLQHFVETVSSAGCNKWIIHARKAWLKGLSPKENREKPPLNYGQVYQLKKDFSELTIVINGGISDFDTAKAQLNFVDGVMIGRMAYHNPYEFVKVDNLFFGDNKAIPTRQSILEAMLPYIEEQLSRGVKLHAITRHLLNLCNSEAGAKNWRRLLSSFPTLSAAEGFARLQKIRL